MRGMRRGYAILERQGQGHSSGKVERGFCGLSWGLTIDLKWLSWLGGAELLCNGGTGSLLVHTPVEFYNIGILYKLICYILSIYPSTSSSTSRLVITSQTAPRITPSPCRLPRCPLHAAALAAQSTPSATVHCSYSARPSPSPPPPLYRRRPASAGRR